MTLLRRLSSFIAAATILVFAASTPALAQSFTSAALAADVSSSTATTLTVDSSTGMSAGQWLYVDREAMRITDVAGTTVTVIRGIQGIVSSHSIGASVYVAAPSAFNLTPPANSSCTTPSTENLYIDVVSGGIYSCVNQTWRSLTIVGPAPVGTILAGNGSYSAPSFSSTITGRITFGRVLVGDGTAASPSFSFASYPATGYYSYGANIIGLSTNGVARQVIYNSGGSGGTTYFEMQSIGALAWSSTADPGATADVILSRDAANTLALRNGTAAQTFNVYNTYTSSTNNEALFVGFSANTGYLQTTKGSGGGSARNLRVETGSTGFLALGTNATIRWYLDGSTGHFLANTDNTYDIGASGATRPRTAYIGTSVVAPTIYVGPQTSSGFLLTPSATFNVLDIKRGDNGDTASINIKSLNMLAAGAITWLGRATVTSGADGSVVLANNAGTSGVTLNAATNAILKIFAQDGTSAANLYTNGSIGFGTTSPTFYLGAGSSTGFMQMSNAAGNQGINFDVSTNGTAWIRSVAGADTATVKANQFSTTGTYTAGNSSLSTSGATIGQSYTISNPSSVFGAMKLASLNSGAGVVLSFDSPANTLWVKSLANTDTATLQVRTFQSSGVEFASLPTGVAGMFEYVTDSNTETWGATIAGGGAFKVLAFFNGTNWTVAGK